MSSYINQVRASTWCPRMNKTKEKRILQKKKKQREQTDSITEHFMQNHYTLRNFFTLFHEVLEVRHVCWKCMTKEFFLYRVCMFWSCEVGRFEVYFLIDFMVKCLLYSIPLLSGRLNHLFILKNNITR